MGVTEMLLLSYMQTKAPVDNVILCELLARVPPFRNKLFAVRVELLRVRVVPCPISSNAAVKFPVILYVTLFWMMIVSPVLGTVPLFQTEVVFQLPSATVYLYACAEESFE